MLASVALPGATARGFNALLPTESDACDAAALLAPSQQQDWLAAYTPDFADTATGYAPPYPAAGLDVLAPVPDVIYRLPVEASVTDPGRPVPPGPDRPLQPGRDRGGAACAAAGRPYAAARRGRLILPEGEGPHPLVLLLHLRGSKCFGSDVFDAVWPCGPAAIPRYEMGYDYLLKALAARGYAVVAPNLVGAFTEAPSWAPPDDSTAAASMDYYRVEPLVDRLLAELAAANQGQSLAFGQDLTGKLDMSHMAIIGHSRRRMGQHAGVTAGRQRYTGGDRGRPRAGQRAVPVLPRPTATSWTRDPDALRTADLPIAVVPAYCDADLKEYPLLGQAYLEQALPDFERNTPAWVTALKTGEHYGFVTIIRGAEHNLQRDLLQGLGGAAGRAGGRAFLAQMAPEFLDVALDRLPAAAIPGFDPAAPLPNTLYGAPIEITALDPTRRLLVLLPAGETDLASNLLGGAITASGSTVVSFCEGTGEQMCIVNETVEPRPEAQAEDWVDAQPKFSGYPPQMRVQWDAADARLSLEMSRRPGRPERLRYAARARTGRHVNT